MILQKLQQARDIIKGSPLKKAGKNEFSKYNYFTPEQINILVHEAEKQVGLIHTFNLERNEYGIYGRLEIHDMEADASIVFIQATLIPEIKATNAAQQVGGAVTYTQRYMLMTAYDIAENALDFDINKKQKPKQVIPDNRFAKMISQVRNADTREAAQKLIATARQYFKFDDDQESILKEWEDNE